MPAIGLKLIKGKTHGCKVGKRERRFGSEVFDDDGKDMGAFQSTATFAGPENQTQVTLRTLFDAKEACGIAANFGNGAGGKQTQQQRGSMWP